jgi:hypothetical protein
MDVAIQERVAQKENELNATYDERMRNYEARCVTGPLLSESLLNLFQRAGLASSSLTLEGTTSRSSGVKRINGGKTS